MIFYKINMLNIYFQQNNYFFCFKRNLSCQPDIRICPPFCYTNYDVSKNEWTQNGARLTLCSSAREFQSLVVIHRKLVFDTTFLHRVHHERPVGDCPPDTVVVQERKPPAFTSSVHPIKPCHLHSLQASWTATQASMQRRRVECDQYS